VAAAIANSPASIGYVNQAYVQGAVKGVALQNREGNFVEASAASGAAGLNAVKLNQQLGGEDCNPPGAKSFPIVSFTWILTHAKGHGSTKAAALRQFLDWALTEQPQQQASQLGYVPITGDVLKRARAAVATIAP
jgi:phosphate transport system substrate-binding protein